MALEELEGDDDGDLAEGEKILDMNEDDRKSAFHTYLRKGLTDVRHRGRVGRGLSLPWNACQ
jgi:hypothetical protein